MRTAFGLLLLFLISLQNTSCQKEFFLSDVDSSLITQPASPGSGTFTATIDGVKFVADRGTSAAITSGVIAITGQSVNGEQIVLRVADSSVHQYTLNIGSASNVGAYSKDTAYTYATNQGNSADQSGGTMTITSVDTAKKTLSGTFSMKVYRQFDSKQKIITAGVFKNISYQTIAIPPATASDTFRVKVDGVQFAVYSVSGFNVFGKINISASNQDVSKTVGISVPSDIKAGTYTFSSFGPDYIGQYNFGTSYMSAGSGTLTILEHNTATKRIRGTFNMNAAEIIGTNSATLSEGYFSKIYQ
ncbi:MAG TPA: DUF6252 family protein [Hanamia sp.]|nr:DUF6252 family protein [Hanamia sp.]